jgi:hypothetical protein
MKKDHRAESIPLRSRVATDVWNTWRHRKVELDWKTGDRRDVPRFWV